jgi:hypothetical protein
MRESASAGFRFGKNASVQRVSTSGGCGNNWGKGVSPHPAALHLWPNSAAVSALA